MRTLGCMTNQSKKIVEAIRCYKVKFSTLVQARDNCRRSLWPFCYCVFQRNIGYLGIDNMHSRLIFCRPFKIWNN